MDWGAARVAGSDRESRADHAWRAAWRPIGRGARALSHRSMVRRCQDAGAAGDGGGARAQDRVRATAVGSHVLQLDGKYPAVVHFAADLVGPPDTSLVRIGRQDIRGRV